jgi:hypothetical protein
MNQSGDIVFASPVLIGSATSVGTFLWDFKAQKATAVALKGMPAVNNLTFEDGGGFTPAINNRGEIAFPAQVEASGGRQRTGTFFRDQDGKLLPVLLPGQSLPDGGQAIHASSRAINDAGAVALLAHQQGDAGNSAYLWSGVREPDAGKLTEVAVIGADAPGGGTFSDVWYVWLNNKNRNVLLDASFGDGRGLHLFAGGKLLPVLVPGQPMPGGGTFKNPRTTGYSVSFANDAGQHAIVVALEDGATAAYLMDADGKLSLILKSGTPTDLGTITSVGGGGGSFGVGLNNKGQVALTVRIDGGVDTMVLLTPGSP